MTIHYIICVEVGCTGCRARFGTPDAVVHYPTPDVAREHALAEGWWTDGDDTDLCDRCKMLPHPPIIPLPRLTVPCTRCGTPADNTTTHRPEAGSV